ncbi:MAG: AI-2E family transporter [Ginsengibacter sp.]
MKNNVLTAYLRLACIIIILIGGGYLAILGEEILLPLAFAFLISLLLLPISNFMENSLKFSRSMAGIVSVLLLLLAFSGIFYVLGSQIADLGNEWPLLKKQLIGLFNDTQTWLSTTFQVNLQKQTEYLNKSTENVLNSGGTIIEKTVLSISSTILMLVFIIIYTLFILIYRSRWMRFVVAAFTERNKTVIYDISENIKNIIRKYIAGLFFEMAILVAASCFVFWILGIKYVFLLGLIVGVFNLIPYVGIFTALAISTAITFATVDASHALYVAITVICIHLIDSNFLMPKIVGSQVKINPLMVILGVVAGELLWGIPGMFLSIPYLAIAKVIFDRIKNLQSLGILLGDEEVKPKSLRSKNKSITEATPGHVQNKNQD